MQQYTLDRFNEQGFAVIEAAFSPAQISAIRDAAERIVTEFDPRLHRSVFSTQHEDRDRDNYFIESAEAVHCFFEEEALDDQGELLVDKQHAINKVGHALHDLVPEFATFCRLPVFAETLRSLGFASAALWQTMYIFKQPRIGGEVRWHQDASYLIADAPGVVGFWIALEDADRDNGCLWVQPGGHRSPLRERFEVSASAPCGQLQPLDNTPWPTQDQAVALEVPAGSMVVFADRMPHFSSHNRSARSRHACTLHFSAADASWSQLNWLQRKSLPAFLV